MPSFVQTQGGLSELALSDTSPTRATTLYWSPTGYDLTGLFSSYAAIYRMHLWVYVLVMKLGKSTARLPLKVYQRQDDGSRAEVKPANPFAALLRRPNPKTPPYYLWLWTANTFNIYGEAFWVKVRPGRGRPPNEIWPLHPSIVSPRRDENNGIVYRVFAAPGNTSPVFDIPEADVVHFRAYNPDTTVRGLSPLEPLRQTLVNEDASRRATAAFWRNSARPSVALSHPGRLTKPAADRLKEEWESIHAGADNYGKVAVLEEGMEPKILSLTAEEAQYIQSRHLNREEVCAAYDCPPPVVGILDRATFSNITAQLRSVYRDTMAPFLGMLESFLDHDLRPEFGGEDLYAEFLLDEVLRGDFEQRAAAYASAVDSGWLQPAEIREKENLPFVEGSDRLFVNFRHVPMDRSGYAPIPSLPEAGVIPPAPSQVPDATPGTAPPEGLGFDPRLLQEALDALEREAQSSLVSGVPALRSGETNGRNGRGVPPH